MYNLILFAIHNTKTREGKMKNTYLSVVGILVVSLFTLQTYGIDFGLDNLKKKAKVEKKEETKSTESTKAIESTQSSILPFGVKLGGQEAKVSDSKSYAKIAKPVSSNADLVVDAEADMIIINAFKCDKEGNVKQGEQPAIILIQGSSKTKLSGTMDKKPLEPGTYIMNVVISSKGTSRVMFTVK